MLESLKTSRIQELKSEWIELLFFNVTKCFSHELGPSVASFPKPKRSSAPSTNYLISQQAPNQSSTAFWTILVSFLGIRDYAIVSFLHFLSQ
jgi:hypothetical protein